MRPNSSPSGHRDHLGGATNEPSAPPQRPSGAIRPAARRSAAASAARHARCATWRSCLHRPEHPGLSTTPDPEPRALATHRASPPCSEPPQLPRHPGLRDRTTSSSTTERRSRCRGGCSASIRPRPAAPDCPLRGPATDYRCGSEAVMPAASKPPSLRLLPDKPGHARPRPSGPPESRQSPITGLTRASAERARYPCRLPASAGGHSARAGLGSRRTRSRDRDDPDDPDRGNAIARRATALTTLPSPKGSSGLRVPIW